MSMQPASGGFMPPAGQSRRGGQTSPSGFLRFQGARFRCLVHLSGAALLWEAVWRRSWPASGWVGLFVALALMGLPQSLPPVWHLFMLMGWVALVAGSLMPRFAGFRRPTRADALARLERDSGLSHRPLRSLEDRPVVATAEGLALWHRHQHALRAVMDRVRLALPSPGLAAVDPQGLRAGVLLLLVIGMAAAGSAAPERIAAALLPDRPGTVAGPGAVLDLWISPPVYTGLPPRLLETGTSPSDLPPVPQAPLAVPVGSTVSARVSVGASGDDTVPQMLINGAWLPFETREGRHYQATLPLTRGDSLMVRLGRRTLGTWSIAVVPDELPRVSWTKAPEPDERGQLLLPVVADDDYGITGLSLILRRGDGDAAAIRQIPLSLPGGTTRHLGAQLGMVSRVDLSGDPWAGLPVVLQVQATDGAGQEGRSAPVGVVLPERVFTHPVAREIAALRRLLLDRGDAARRDLALRLTALVMQPDRFRGEVAVMLALSVARSRLIAPRLSQRPLDGEARDDLAALLWEAALQVEEGRSAGARKDVLAAAQALEKLLQDNAGEAEIAQALAEFQESLNQFLESLEQDAARRGAPPDMPPGLPPGLAGGRPSVNREGLEAALDQLRAMSGGGRGSREAARRMLGELQRVLEGLEAGNGALDATLGETTQALKALEELRQRQQTLMDRSFNRAQQSTGSGAEHQDAVPPGGFPWSSPPPRRRDRTRSPPAPPDPDTGAQRDLHQDLSRLLERLDGLPGGLPLPLERAERSMGEAERALRRGQTGEAVAPQSQATEGLRQGMSALEQRLSDALSQGSSGGGAGGDPLGRPRRGFGPLDSGSVTLPAEGERMQAREILEELRRRAADRGRSRLELDYLERLLRQF